MIDIHKVKPVHGWREFIGEVGIIVLGVLIALCAEQVVEALHWRSEVHDARAAFDAALRSARVDALERVYLSDCLKRRIARVRQYLDSASYRSPIIVRGAPIRPWDQSSWTTALASGVVSHMPLDVRAEYARLFTDVEEMKIKNDDEYTAWSGPVGLNDDPTVSPQAADRLRGDLARASADNRLITLVARQFNASAKRMNIHIDSDGATDLYNLQSRPCKAE